MSVVKAKESLKNLSEALEYYKSENRLPVNESDSKALETLTDLTEDVLIHVRTAIFGYEDVRDISSSLAFAFHILPKSSVLKPRHLWRGYSTASLLS